MFIDNFAFPDMAVLNKDVLHITDTITNGYIPGSDVTKFAEETSLAIIDSVKRDFVLNRRNNSETLKPETQINGSVQNLHVNEISLEEIQVTEDFAHPSPALHTQSRDKYVTVVNLTSDEKNNLQRDESLSPVVTTDKKLLLSTKDNDKKRENNSPHADKRSKVNPTRWSAESETMDDETLLLKSEYLF